MKKRPSTDFMERIQKDINASMLAILVDWLVEVTFLYYITYLSSISETILQIGIWILGLTIFLQMIISRHVMNLQFKMQVAEEYRLVPDTVYLTVNYIDRYLSGNVMNRQRLQLLGVACMMIAA